VNAIALAVLIAVLVGIAGSIVAAPFVVALPATTFANGALS